MLHAFWHVLSFGLLAAICFLWRQAAVGSDRLLELSATSRKIRGGQARSRRTRRRTRTERRKDAAVVQGDDEREGRERCDFWLGGGDDRLQANFEAEMGKLE